MLEYEIGTGVAHFQGEFRRPCFIEAREIITREAVADCVIRPILDASSLLRSFHKLAKVGWCDRSVRFSIRLQPEQKVRLDLNKSPPRALCLTRRDFDKA